MRFYRGHFTLTKYLDIVVEAMDEDDAKVELWQRLEAVRILLNLDEIDLEIEDAE